MSLILIVVLLGILVYLVFSIRTSVLSLSASTKQLVELIENSMKTRGALFPVASQYDIMTERKGTFDRTDFHDAPFADPKYISEYMKAGKSWDNLKSDVENHFSASLRLDGREAVYKQMIISNIDVFYGRKSIEQAEEEIRQVKEDYAVVGKKGNENYERQKEYLEKVRVNFDKLKIEGAFREE